MLSRLLPAAIGVSLAIAATAAMDLAGYGAFSALPLAGLLVFFWFGGGYSRTEVGFVRSIAPMYLLAALVPIVVIGALALIAALAGAVDTGNTDWGKALANLALITLSTILVGMVTEEGFFRGWLWASLVRADVSPFVILIATSVIFSLWHVSAATLTTEFSLPGPQVPLYLVNAALIGMIWGLLRQWSGSVIVASVSHGVWNGLAYTFFGFGERTGALGIERTEIYGPEVGLIGLVLNVLIAGALVVFGPGWAKRVHEARD